MRTTLPNIVPSAAVPLLLLVAVVALLVLAALIVRIRIEQREAAARQAMDPAAGRHHPGVRPARGAGYSAPLCTPRPTRLRTPADSHR